MVSHWGWTEYNAESYLLSALWDHLNRSNMLVIPSLAVYRAFLPTFTWNTLSPLHTHDPLSQSEGYLVWPSLGSPPLVPYHGSLYGISAVFSPLHWPPSNILYNCILLPYLLFVHLPLLEWEFLESRSFFVIFIFHIFSGPRTGLALRVLTKTCWMNECMNKLMNEQSAIKDEQYQSWRRPNSQ